MSKPIRDWNEDDWYEYYRTVGEHVALVDLSSGKIEGAKWLGAQKFVVAENNRRHQEFLTEAGKSRKVATRAMLISVGAALASVGSAIAAFLV